MPLSKYRGKLKATKEKYQRKAAVRRAIKRAQAPGKERIKESKKRIKGLKKEVRRSKRQERRIGAKIAVSKTKRKTTAAVKKAGRKVKEYKGYRTTPRGKKISAAAKRARTKTKSTAKRAGRKTKSTAKKGYRKYKAYQAPEAKTARYKKKTAAQRKKTTAAAAKREYQKERAKTRAARKRPATQRKASPKRKTTQRKASPKKTRKRKPPKRDMSGPSGPILPW